MRLTLRTLLAYLDDTLEPAETKLIGQKVAESTAAQELIERIKKVTRRRSLANPPVFGDESKLDPNTVAAYLSDVLSPEEAAAVEQTCLEHDMYLAEVAACHQILTLMLSEPVRVPPTARQRMYRLVKGRESIPYRKPPAFKPAAEIGEMAVVCSRCAGPVRRLGLRNLAGLAGTTATGSARSEQSGRGQCSRDRSSIADQARQAEGKPDQSRSREGA